MTQTSPLLKGYFILEENAGARGWPGGRPLLELRGGGRCTRVDHFGDHRGGFCCRVRQAPRRLVACGVHLEACRALDRRERVLRARAGL